MHRHRFRDQLDLLNAPRPTLPGACAGGFMACPLALVHALPQQWAWQQQVYQAAFRQAQAVVRPSVLERVMNAVWN